MSICPKNTKAQVFSKSTSAPLGPTGSVKQMEAEESGVSPEGICHVILELVVEYLHFPDL